jgi:5-methylcytosine-specific restriction endonuclease McrA
LVVNVPRIAIPARVRKLVFERAHNQCEYCLVHQNDSVVRHNIDHIISLKHQGPTEEHNLALACAECNYSKGTDIATLDPDGGQLVRLFDPRKDVWSDHFALEGAVIVGLTSIGRGTVLILAMNEPSRVKQRTYLQSIGHYPTA